MPPQLWLVPHLPSTDGGTLWLGLHTPGQPDNRVAVAWRGPGNGAATFTAPWQAFNAGDDRFWYARVRLTDLRPDCVYQLTASSQGTAPSPPALLRTLPTAIPARSLHGDRLTLLLGSCFDHARGAAGQIGALPQRLPGAPPHLKLLCGDQVYLDLPARELLPRDEPGLRQRLLGKYLRNWGHGVDPPGRGYGSFLRWGANHFLSDDHEFWNNYPRWALYVMSSFRHAPRERLTTIAHALFRAFQTDYGHPGGERCLRELRIGDPARPGAVAIFTLDGRYTRTDRRANTRDELADLKARLAALETPAIVALSQPAFQRITHRAGYTGIGDQGLADLDDYPELIAALDAAPRDVMVLSGDIHGGRLAVTRRSPSKQIFEVISSPIALCKPGSYYEKDAAAMFPEVALPGVARTPVDTRKPVVPRDQVALLGLSHDGRRIVVDIRFWPIDGQSVRPFASFTHYLA